MRRAWPLAALALALRLLPAAAGEPPAGPAAEAKGKTVVEVKLEGLITVRPEDVLQHMTTRKGRTFHPATYGEDFTRLYNLGLFDNVKLMPPEVTAEGVRVRVVFTERPIIHKLEIRGNRRVRTSGLLNQAREDKTVLTVGSRYDPYAAHRMARSMKAHCIKRRFPMAEVKARTEPVPGRPGYAVAVFEVAEDSRVYIKEVVFRGRKALPRKKLLKTIRGRPGGFLRPSGKYSEDALRIDQMLLQSLYHNSGYSDARVEVLPAEITAPLGRRRRRFATVVFEISEGRLYTYGKVSFKGLESVSSEEGLRRLRLAPGAPYSSDELVAAQRRLRDLLGETGRPFAQVGYQRKRSARPGVVDLEFSVNEGPRATVGDIRIRGNSRTRDRVIRRQLEVFPGDIYNSRKLNRSRRRVRGLGLFAKVNAYPVRGDEPDTVDIELEVEESMTGALNIGGSVSPEDGSMAMEFSIVERNFDWSHPPKSWDDLLHGGAFRGGGQQLTLRASASESIETYRLDFYNPWIWDTPEHYAFGMGFFHTDKDFGDYEDRRSGLSLRLGRRLFTRRLRLSTQYRLQSIFIEGIDEDLPQDIQDDEGTTKLASMRLGLSFDGRDSRLLPTRGVLLQASEEIFGGFLSGDEDFRKTRAEGHLFLPVLRTRAGPHVLHFYGRTDWINGYDLTERIPVFERLYGGGVGSVRGYDYRTLSPRVDGEVVGGNFRAVQSVEYAFPLAGKTLRGAVYFDAGEVWTEEGEFQFHDQKRSVGVGLHVTTPMGPVPIKLYFSKALNPDDEHDTETFQMTFSLLF